ncbi:MAG: hypothetical protein JWO31_1754 [Phycisphaerales bacterium]|nr:hypothetical protein [Phycisphaerales bacterium]
MQKILISAAGVIALACSTAGAASIAVTTAGTPYTENFNIGTTPAAYVPITTVTGLSVYVSGGGTTNDIASGRTTPVNYANAQSLTEIRRNIAYGNTQAITITNQVLSTVQYNVLVAPGGYSAFGLTYVNNTGAAVDAFALTFSSSSPITGAASTAINPTVVDTTNFSYAFNAPDLADGSATWTAAPAFDFSTIAGTATVPVSATTNPQPTGAVSGLNWLPGQTLTFRWRDTQTPEPAADRVMAIDDVTATFVPEPGSLALVGLAAVAVVRRRR